MLPHLEGNSAREILVWQYFPQQTIHYNSNTAIAVPGKIWRQVLPDIGGMGGIEKNLALGGAFGLCHIKAPNDI